jgi:hypothetical protein
MSISAVNSVPVLAAGSVGAPPAPAAATPSPAKEVSAPVAKAATAPGTGKVVDKSY